MKKLGGKMRLWRALRSSNKMKNVCQSINAIINQIPNHLSSPNQQFCNLSRDNLDWKWRENQSASIIANMKSRAEESCY